jgi:putative ABC transport system ATP-binding protein
MIEVKTLTHKYPGKSETIKYPDFQCAKGSDLLLIGPSGSGKSTLLHILGGFLRPSGGEIVLSKKALHLMSSQELNHFRKDHIGIIFQRHHFIRSLNVLENLQYTDFFSQASRTKLELLELLQFLGLLEYKSQAVGTLSEGQKQRLSVARALVHRPSILLADEPTSSLDDVNCALVAQLLKKAQKEFNSTLVVVSHDHRLKNYFSDTIELSS